MNPTRSRRALAALARGALPLVLALVVPVAAGAQQAPADEDPNLRQRIGAAQPVATDRAVLARGHVDVGPRFHDGRWTLMIHDDQAKAGGGESVWRHADRTVLAVVDDARHQVPDDPAYAFLPSEPGADVYVVPQTQDPDVVWVGWNTQDPEVMETIDRGVTMRLTGVQGPGSLVVYLQSGDFAKPQVLWNSTGEPQPVWVAVNTHSHANWVFSGPGVYLVQVEIVADLVDGTTVSDVRELRFAVGSDVDPDDAFAASWRGPRPTPASADLSAATEAAADEDGGVSASWVAALAVVVVALAALLALLAARGRRAKRLARARSASEDADAAGSDA